ncbi:replicative DNA helicase [Clostridium sp. UBA3887]|uniref:replicative DNA helicase n=1 Tax=Clostridium sp. UBA3887 TaxID=1946356 RepID=UPI003217E4C2
MEMVMPYSVEAESTVLGGIINNSEKLNEVEDILNQSDFYMEKHQLIYNTMRELSNRGVSIDLVTLSNELNTNKKINKCGGMTYLTSLSGTSNFGENIINHANIVREKSERRRLIKAGMKLIEDSYDGDINQVSSFMEMALDSVADKNKDGEMVSIGDALQDAITSIEDKFKNGSRILGKTTGFKSLDNTISGLNKGDFIVIAARPSMGKTAFALNIGQATSREGNVGIFSLEMPEEQLMQRFLSARCLIPFQTIKTGKLSPAEFERISTGAADLANRNIFIDDNSTSLSDIKARCRSLKKKHGLDVVIIDYLQLLETSEKTYSREQEIAKISRELKKMAKKLEVTVIALSQLSRAPEQRADKRPMLSDLRESGSIEQDADVVMFLYRDEYYDEDSSNKGISEVIIGKNRNGQVKTINLAWRGEYQRFGELAV